MKKKSQKRDELNKQAFESQSSHNQKKTKNLQTGLGDQTHHLPQDRIQQARHPIISLGVLTLIIGSLVSGLWLISSSGLVTNRFKPQLESELSKALSRQVSVNKMEGGLFDRVVLKGVTIATPSQPDSLAITIERVVVQYSLWDILIRKRPLAESLHQIELIRPLIEFKRSPQGKWHGPELLTGSVNHMVAGPATPAFTTLPAIKVMLYDGQIKLTNDIETASVMKLKGLLNLRDPNAARLYLSGQTEGSRRHNVRLSGILDLTANAFRLNLDAKKIELRPIERVIKIAEDFEIASGQSDLALEINSRAAETDDLIHGAETTGQMVLYDVAIKTRFMDELIRDIYGVADLKNKDLELKKLQAILGTTTWSASGEIKNLNQPWLDIKVQSERLELADFLQTFPRLKRLNTSGAGEATIYVKGKLPHIAATANLKMAKGKIGQLRIRNFESLSRYQAGELKLLQAKGVVARGWVEGQGKISLPANQKEPARLWFVGRANDLELQDISSLAGIDNVHGVIDGEVTLSGRLNTPRLIARVKSKQLELYGNRLEKIDGTLSAADGAIQVALTGDWGPIKKAKLKTLLGYRSQKWQLHFLELFRKNTKLISAKGEWQGGKEKLLSGDIRADRIPINLIPVLPEALKHLNGTISFDGKLQGSAIAPRFSGTFNSENIHRVGSRTINTRGHITMGAQRLKLKDIWVDNQRLFLSGFIDFEPNLSLHLTSTIKRMPLRHLVGLLGLNKNDGIGGLVNGEIDLSGPIETLYASGWSNLSQLAWGPLQAESGYLNFASSNNKIVLKDFTLKQADGEFNMFLESDLDFKKGKFKLKSWMEKFRIGNQHYSGDLTLDGRHGYEKNQPVRTAELSVRRLAINQQYLPPILAKVLMTNQKLKIARFDWSNEITMIGLLEFGKPLLGNFEISIHDSDLLPFRKLIDRKNKALTIPVTGQVKLELLPLQKKISFDLKNAQEQTLVGTVLTDDSLPQTGTDYAGNITMHDLSASWLLDLMLAENPEKSPKGNLTGRVDFVTRNGKMQTMESKLTIKHFKHGQWQFNELQADWSFDKTELVINRFEGKQALGSLRTVRAGATITPEGYWKVRSGFEADNFKFLSRNFHGHVAVNGQFKLTPQYDFKLNLASQNFAIDRYQIGLLKAELDYQDQMIKIKTLEELDYYVNALLRAPPDGSLIFQMCRVGNQKKNWIAGQGRIDGTGTSDIKFTINDVNADIIAKVLGWPQKWQGQAFGSVHYTDQNKVPRFEIPVKIENGSVVDIPFDLFSGKIIIDHDWLYFDGIEQACVLHRANQYTMKLSGKLPLPQTPESEKAMYGEEMDIQVTMPEGELSFLAFIPQIESASGSASLDLNVKGTMTYPTLNGIATIKNGTIYSRYYTPVIKQLNADLVFEDNKIIAKRVYGEIGRGRLVITPLHDRNWLTEFRRLIPHRLNLRIQSEKERIKLDTTNDFEFISAMADVDMTISGTLESPVIGGRLALSDGAFTYPAIPRTDYAMQVKPVDVVYDEFRLKSVKNLWYYKDVVGAEEIIRAQLAQDQEAVFNGGKYTLRGDGEISIARGSLVYMNNDFSLDPNEETVFRFRGRDKPRVNGLARTTIRNVHLKDEGRSRDAIIYLRVQGTVGEFKIKLESEPELTQAQIVSLLTVGEDYSNWSQSEIDEKIQGAGARLLGRFASNLIGREIEKSIKRITPLELDVIDIRLGGVEKLADTFVSGSSNSLSADTSPSSSVTGTSLLQDTQIDVGKYLTDDLFLNYRGVLKEKEESRGDLAWQSYLGLEYNIDPSRKIKVYKNFDTDSDQELFWGIEGRVQFEGWAPQEKETVTPTPTSKSEN